jgi:drug/metabolite transporter (DMT)-like permease
MRTETPESLTLFSGLAMVAAGLGMMAWHAEPVTLQLATVLIAMGLFGAFGSMCFLAALKHTSPVHVSQCHYTQLVTGGLLTWFIWHETPTAYMLVGSALIVAAGLLMAVAMARERDEVSLELFMGPGI